MKPSDKRTFDRRVAERPLNAILMPMEIDEPQPLSGEAPDRIIVMRSVRGDPLAWLHSHRRIDDAQYLAGRRWQELYERAELGAVQAMDTSKDPVDGGGGVSELATDGQRQAVAQLTMAALALQASVYDIERGRERVALIRDILGRGMFPTQAAALRGLTGEYQVAKLSREFRRALDALALSFKWQNTAAGKMPR